MRLRLEFKPQDCWIGVYWRTKKGAQEWYDWIDVWVCVLPMLPLHIYWPRNRHRSWR